MYTCPPCACSSSQSQLITPPAPEQNLLGVMGVSDWDFLCPVESVERPDEEEDTSKRPSLDDFDGEIAVFQVSTSATWLICDEAYYFSTKGIVAE